MTTNNTTDAKEQLESSALFAAADGMDWGQVVMNGGPPCFHLSGDGRFCGRAERWDGHGLSDFHEFKPLGELLRDISANAKHTDQP